MVFQSEKQDSGSMSEKKIRKIYTVAEIEAQTLSGSENTKISTKVANLKQVDPAIMHFSTNSSVTRYDKNEIEVLKEAKSSQAPPPCYYDPRIIRLNILKYQKTHPEDYEGQMKTFRELLPNLSMNSWDPSVLELLNNYHKSLLYPHHYVHNDYNASRSINQNFNRRVSWGDQKQFLDNHNRVPSYNQKNFFDNITTTTTMRPPRMGVGSLGYQKTRQSQQHIRNAKGNSCSNERYSQYPQNLSSGSISTNETKSSYDESIDKSLTDKSESIDINLKSGDQENTEPEPEWFSWPASRHDVIDLHGFDEDEASNLKSDINERPPSRNSNRGFDDFVRHQRQNEVASSAYRRSSYNQSPRYPRYNNNNNVQGGSSYYNNNARYRNPLHQSKDTSTSFNSTFGSDFSSNQGHSIEVIPNPFFEAWKRKNDSQWMGHGNQMMTIADVENALKMKQMQQQQMHGLPYGGNPAVPQFFQNAANHQNRMGGRQMPGGSAPFVYDNMQQPTAEQLQQHTQEIMRNAILRKQFQDGKFP